MLVLSPLSGVRGVDKYQHWYFSLKLVLVNIFASINTPIIIILIIHRVVQTVIFMILHWTEKKRITDLAHITRELGFWACLPWNMSENTRNMFHFLGSTKMLLFKTRSLIWEAHAAPVWSGWSANWTLFRSQLIACIHYQSQVGRGTWLIHYPPTAYSSMSGCQWLITQLN